MLVILGVIESTYQIISAKELAALVNESLDSDEFVSLIQTRQWTLTSSGMVQIPMNADNAARPIIQEERINLERTYP